MLLSSNKLRLAAVGIAVVAVLGGTTALAASHRSVSAPEATQSEAAGDKQDEHQDNGPDAKTADDGAAGDQQGEQ